MEKEKASALNVLAEKIVDISGSYVMAIGNSKKPDSLTLTRDDKSGNAFFMTDPNGKKETQRVLAENLPGDNRLLLQIRDKSGYSLIPAELTDEGLRIYIPASGNSKKTDGWDQETWLRTLDKHGLTTGRDSSKLVRGQLDAKDYTAKVKAALNEMFAAKAMGEGLLLVKAELYQAMKEKEERRQAFISSCASASPEQIREGLKDGMTPDTPNREGVTPLMFAARSNENVEAVKVLLEAGGDIDLQSGRGGDPALLLAAQFNKNPEIVACLIKAGAKVQMQNGRGESALMLARKNPAAKEVAQILLKAGADVNARDRSGKNVFMIAVQEGNFPFAESLLQAKADVNAQDSAGATALLYAVRGGKTEAVDFLLKAGADGNIQDKSGYSAFGQLLGRLDFIKDKEKIFDLLGKGMDINTPLGYSKETLLMRAAREQKPDAFVELLRFSPDLRAKTSGGRDVFAAFKETYRSPSVPLLQWVLPKIDDPATIELLVKSGADIRAGDANGVTTLMAAVGSDKSPAFVKKLLELGADVNARTKTGETALMYAAGRGNQEVCSALRQAGADPLARSTSGWHALLFAAKSGNSAIIKDLITAGADVNSGTKEGWTALNQATRSGNADAVRTLLKAGAKVANATPLPVFVDAAGVCGTEILAILLEAGADPKATSPEGVTALIQAARYNQKHPDVIAYLHKLGMDVNAKTKKGHTALMAAAMYNPNPDVVTTLLRCGADIKVTATENYIPKTALHWAAEFSNNPQVVKNLVFGGIDVNVADDKTLVTPLHLAARSRDSSPEKIAMLLDLGADGRIQGGVYGKETAYGQVTSEAVRRSPLYMRLNDSQFNKPKALSAELLAEREAYQKQIRDASTVQTAAAVPPHGQNDAATTPEPAPAQAAVASAQKASSAQSPAATEKAAPVYPPLVLGSNGKPKIAAHKTRFENGAVELALQVLAPGKTIEAVRIDNLGGISARWRSDGKEDSAPLFVSQANARISSGVEAMSLPAGDKEILLTLSLKDNGAFAARGAEFRATVFFVGGERAMCQIDAN